MKYGVENIRSLKCVEPIEIRPITLLVGRNSSGKSTFLRTIPLFRQSISTKTSSLVLWYGDLVDFGSFDVSVNKANRDKPIIFNFIIDKAKTTPSGIFYQMYGVGEAYVYKDISFSIFISPLSDRTRISRLIIDIKGENTKIDLKFENKNILEEILINEKLASLDLNRFPFGLNAGALFPELFSYAKSEKSARASGRYYIAMEESAFEIEAFRIMRARLDNRIADKTLRQFVNTLFKIRF